MDKKIIELKILWMIKCYVWKAIYLKIELI